MNKVPARVGYFPRFHSSAVQRGELKNNQNSQFVVWRQRCSLLTFKRLKAPRDWQATLLSCWVPVTSAGRHMAPRGTSTSRQLQPALISTCWSPRSPSDQHMAAEHQPLWMSSIQRFSGMKLKTSLSMALNSAVALYCSLFCSWHAISLDVHDTIAGYSPDFIVKYRWEGMAVWLIILILLLKTWCSPLCWRLVITLRWSFFLL